MTISGPLGITVYSGLTEDNIQVEQTGLERAYAQRLSQDGRYLVAGSNEHYYFSKIYEDQSMSQLRSE